MRFFVLFLFAMIGLSCAKEEPIPVEKVLGTWKNFLSTRSRTNADCYFKIIMELNPTSMTQTLIVDPSDQGPFDPSCEEVLQDRKRKYEFTFRGEAEGRRFVIDEVLSGEGDMAAYARRKREIRYFLGAGERLTYDHDRFAYYPGSYGESNSPVGDENSSVAEEAL